VRVEENLREARRPAQPLSGRADYVRVVSTYLRAEPVAGWEPAADVRKRVTECIERLVAPTRGDVAVVSHGLALSLFLGLTPGDWERIPLPAVAVADPSAGCVLEPWAGVDDLVSP